MRTLMLAWLVLFLVGCGNSKDVTDYNKELKPINPASPKLEVKSMEKLNAEVPGVPTQPARK
ncbi:MAG: hypothetical protein U0798_13945 [Gemmataceae bacterium]